jgi:hypothetical protein
VKDIPSTQPVSAETLAHGKAAYREQISRRAVDHPPMDRRFEEASDDE